MILSLLTRPPIVSKANNVTCSTDLAFPHIRDEHHLPDGEKRHSFYLFSTALFITANIFFSAFVGDVSHPYVTVFKMVV